MQWGRYVENQLRESNTTVSNLRTLVSNVSTQLGTSLAARRTADSKNQIFLQSSTPDAKTTNDLWFDFSSNNVLRFYDGVTWEIAPLTVSNLFASGGSLTTQVNASGITGLDSDNSIRFRINESGAWVRGPYASYDIAGNYGGYLTLRTDTVSSEDVGLLAWGWDGTNFTAGLTLTEDFLGLTGGAGELSLESNFLSLENAEFRFVEQTTTTGTASASLVTNGSYRVLRRTTSLREAKRLIEDAPEIDFLAFRPRTWFDKTEIIEAGLDPDSATEVDCLNAGLRRVPGFIAEETDELFTTYDNGKLSGISYDRVSVAIYSTLKNIDSRLRKLENK